MGSCLYSVFFRMPAVQTRPSSLHRLQGNSPSHYKVNWVSPMLLIAACRPATTATHLGLLHAAPLTGFPDPLVPAVGGAMAGVVDMCRGGNMRSCALGCVTLRLGDLGGAAALAGALRLVVLHGRRGKAATHCCKMFGVAVRYEAVYQGKQEVSRVEVSRMAEGGEGWDGYK